ncbi:MAG: hypothetical protein IKE94_05710 [Aeriscardovia sp.]|nr:hypothetical protein [Aeriscardovia sp.]
MARTFEVCYTQKDGRRITGQLYTANTVSWKLEALVNEEATDIIVTEYKKGE